MIFAAIDPGSVHAAIALFQDGHPVFVDDIRATNGMLKLPYACSTPTQKKTIMKTLIAAAMLLASTSAFAIDDSTSLPSWDCPHGVRVTRQEDGTFSANPLTKKKITQTADFEAPGPGDFEVRLDNKACKYRFKPKS